VTGQDPHLAQRVGCLEERNAMLESQVAQLMAWVEAQQNGDGGPPLAEQDRELFTAISNVQPAGGAFTVSDLQDLAQSHYDLSLAIAAVARGKDARIALGQCLARLDGRQFGRLRTRRGGKEGGVRLWVIEALGELGGVLP
jgi:hypothetical protein